MQLTDDDIREFREIWKAEFNEEISIDQARFEATLLLELYATCAESMATDVKAHPLSPSTQSDT